MSNEIITIYTTVKNSHLPTPSSSLSFSFPLLLNYYFHPFSPPKERNIFSVSCPLYCSAIQVQLNFVFISSFRCLVIFYYYYDSVGTAVRSRARRPRTCGSIPGRGENFLFSPQFPDRLWVHPTSYRRVEFSFCADKAAWRETNYWSPANSKIKWSCTTIFLYTFTA